VLSVKFPNIVNKKFKILLLGSHCDDIEIGCGGTLLKLVDLIKNLDICWVVFSSGTMRKKEALSSARAILKKVKSRNIVINNFKNGFFPYIGNDIKEYFEQLKIEFCPDLIFTHYRDDLHQDHRVVSDLTWNTFRDHLIYEYEIPKYDGDIGTPNLYVNLDESLCRKKVNYLMKYFKTQREKRWFTDDLFFSMMRVRGMESNSPTKYAEGFYVRKIVI